MRTALLLAALAPLTTLAQIAVELGPEETVMAWNDGQPCGMEDIADLPARAFVDAIGRVHLIAGHFKLYQSTGDNLKTVHRDCSAPVSSSHFNPDPRAYDATEFISAPYTFDGQTVYALLHNEYHGELYGNCNQLDELFNCWWNAVTLIVSQDGGATFRHAPPLVPPAHVVASSPYDFDPDNTTGPFGFFEPSNILSSGGYYYALVATQPKHAQGWGMCLMRTNALADPTSWRAWDGTGFSIVLDRGVCPTLQSDELGGMNSSLSFNTYLRRNLLVGCYDDRNFYFSTSESLTSWSGHQLLMDTDVWWTPDAGDPRGYPSLLQPGDPSRNFERTGRSPYLYYTHWERDIGLYNRNLMRRRLRFTVPGDEGRYQVLELPMNEYRGSTTLDASFYGNDGVLENGAMLDVAERATGPAAVRLPAGASARIRVRDAPTLDRVGSLTIEGFLRVEKLSSDHAAIVEKQDMTLRNYGLSVTSAASTTPGVLTFSFSAPGGLPSVSEGDRRVDDGRWHHVAVVYDGPALTARYYVDGAIDVERRHGASLGGGVNDGDLLIGTDLVGWIDGVVVHDHVRTAQEIRDAAVGTGNVELCNGADDDGDGTPDDGFSCIQGTTETRACASAPGGNQNRICGNDCTLPEWPACPEAPPADDLSRSDTCGCGLGAEPSLPWVFLAALELYRRARARGRTDLPPNLDGA